MGVDGILFLSLGPGLEVKSGSGSFLGPFTLCRKGMVLSLDYFLWIGGMEVLGANLTFPSGRGWESKASVSIARSW